MNEGRDDKEKNDRMKEFLRSQPDEGDDFEKEAREGYQLLSGEEEALELKARVDARINREIGTQHNRSTFYWMAAAALLIFIGFSVYFVTDNPPQPAELSLSVEDRKEELRPAETSTYQPHTERATAQHATAKQEQAEAPLIRKRSPEKKTAEAETEGERLSNESAAAAMKKSDELAAVAEGAGVVTAAEVEMPKAVDLDASAPPPQPMKAAEKRGGQNARSAAPVRESANAAFESQAVTATPVITVAYPKGKDSLCALLKRDLPAEIGRFDVILFVNTSGAVEKTRLLNTYSLTRDQKRTLEKVLLSVKGFTLSADPGPGGLAEYRFGCAP
jgi:hypothetical protein